MTSFLLTIQNGAATEPSRAAAQKTFANTADGNYTAVLWPCSTEDGSIDVTTAVCEIAAWYNSLPPDFVDLQTLLYQRKNLSTLLAALLPEISKAIKDKEIREAQIDIGRAKLEQTAGDYKVSKSSAHTWAKAEYIASNAEMIISAAELNGEVSALYLIKNTIDGLLSAMQQHIAVLRGEEKNTPNHQI